MINFPLVSIFAICHNHKRFVLDTLNSIIHQSYPNIELIIINNLENDGCSEIITEWISSQSIKCKFIQNKAPLSVSQNMNLALTHCNGNYFQLIACDDILIPDKIAKQVAILEKNTDCAACFGNMLFIDENGLPLSFAINNQNNDYPIEGLKLACFEKILLLEYRINSPTALIRTDLVKEVGGYDERFIMEDDPMWLKLSQKHLFFFINDFLVKYRRHSNNLSSKKIDLQFDRLNFIQLYRDKSALYKKAIQNWKFRTFYLYLILNDKRSALKYFVISPSLLFKKQYWFCLLQLLK